MGVGVSDELGTHVYHLILGVCNFIVCGYCAAGVGLDHVRENVSKYITTNAL